MQSYRLRPHQELAIQKARESFLKGHKHICLCACVASGKTLIAKNMLEAAIAKGLKVGFMSSRVVLIENLQRYFKDVKNAEIGTIQYYANRNIELDFCIFDENDFYNSKSKNSIKCTRSITLSGTPISSDGFACDYDDIIDIIQIPQLIKLGLAKPIKVISNSRVDTSTLKKQAGDFHKGQSFELMEKAKIKKGLVDTYKKYASDRTTILFAIDTKHAESLKKEFLEAGVKCDTTHSKKNNDARLAFERGEIKLLINVMQLTTGYDFVKINCVMFARPCASIPLFIQCVGRGIRLNPDAPSDDCLVIDCAEVLKRTDFHPMQKLDLKRKKQDKFTKCPLCSNKMKLINRKHEAIDQYEYKVISSYKCDCGETLEQENYKIINRELCEDGTHFFEPVNGLQFQQDQKAIKFNLVCKCGFEKKFRELVLTDDELKEIKLEEALKSGATWEDVKMVLLKACKDNGYHHRYAIRLIDSLKAKNYTPKSAIESIKTILKQNKKISALMYI